MGPGDGRDVEANRFHRGGGRRLRAGGHAADIIARLNELTTAFVTREETKAYLETVGAKPFRATPEELGTFQEADTKRWAEIVAIAKIEKK